MTANGTSATVTLELCSGTEDKPCESKICTVSGIKDEDGTVTITNDCDTVTVDKVSDFVVTENSYSFKFAYKYVAADEDAGDSSVTLMQSSMKNLPTKVTLSGTGKNKENENETGLAKTDEGKNMEPAIEEESSGAYTIGTALAATAAISALLF